MARTQKIKIINILLSSVDGKIATHDQESSAERRKARLTNHEDFTHLQKMTAQCDAVFIGAKSLQSETGAFRVAHLRKDRREPHWFIMTKSGKINFAHPFWKQKHIPKAVFQMTSHDKLDPAVKPRGDNESQLLSRGAAVSSRGTAVSSRGAAVSSRGAAVSSRGAAVSSRGAAVSSRGAAVSSRGSTAGSIPHYTGSIFAFLDFLSKQNFKKIALLGGGELNGFFWENHLISELHLTISPQVLGVQNAPQLISTSHLLHTGLHLQHIRKKNDFLFLHYKVKKNEKETGSRGQAAG